MNNQNSQYNQNHLYNSDQSQPPPNPYNQTSQPPDPYKQHQPPQPHYPQTPYHQPPHQPYSPPYTLPHTWPVYGQPTRGEGKAIASLVLGIIGMVAWFLPFLGFPITITGLVLGVKGRAGTKRGLATAGVVLCIIGLSFTSINSIAGAVMGLLGYM